MNEKRKSITQLVKEAIPAKSGKSWYESITTEERIYVQEVIGEVIANPEAALTAVAEALISELKIDRSITTVAQTLREMIRDAQKKT